MSERIFTEDLFKPKKNEIKTEEERFKIIKVTDEDIRGKKLRLGLITIYILIFLISILIL